MTDQILMNILNATDNLTEIKFRLLLCDLIILNKIVELSFGGYFHDYKDIIRSVKNFIEFNDVGMIDKFQYFNLSFNLNWNKNNFRNHIFIFHFLFINYLDSYLDTC